MTLFQYLKCFKNKFPHFLLTIVVVVGYHLRGYHYFHRQTWASSGLPLTEWLVGPLQGCLPREAAMGEFAGLLFHFV